MSANFVDGLIGYEYFIENNGNISLEDLNSYLIKKDRNPIAQRTYKHYRSLMSYGFRSYFPINQFDVSRMLGQLPVAPDRRRFDREIVDLEAEISFDGITWVAARILNMSMVGFGMTTTSKIAIEDSDPIWVRTKKYHDIPAILVWKKFENDKAKIGVRAVEFVSRFSVSKKKKHYEKLAGLLIVKKTSEQGLSWRELYDLMRKIEKLLDASSELLKYVGERIDRKIKISPPFLSSIKFSSPGGLNVIIDWKVFALLIALIRLLKNWRVDKDRFIEENRSLKLKNDMREIQIEFLRKSVKSRKVAKLDITKQLLGALPNWFKDILNINELPSHLFKPGSLENQMFTEQLVPTAADLIGGDDPEIEVEVEETSSNGNSKK